MAAAARARLGSAEKRDEDGRERVRVGGRADDDDERFLLALSAQKDEERKALA